MRSAVLLGVAVSSPVLECESMMGSASHPWYVDYCKAQCAFFAEGGGGSGLCTGDSTGDLIGCVLKNWPFCSVDSPQPSTAAPTLPSTAQTPPSTIATPPSTVATPPSTVATPPSTVATPPSTVATPPSTIATPPSTIATPPSTAPTAPCVSLVSWVTAEQCALCQFGSTQWPCNSRSNCSDQCFHQPTTPAPVVVPTQSLPPSDDSTIRDVIARLRASDFSFLQYQTPSGAWELSTLYTKDDMISATQKAMETGVGALKLYSGSEFGADAYKYALTNIAAFLAQAMQETIQYNACDENNWDFESYPDSAYRAASACGQLGQSYGNYKCPAGDEHMACEVDPNMELVATTHAKWYGAPPPLFCGPKTKMPVAPKWSTGGWCNPALSLPILSSFDDVVRAIQTGEKCRDYKGQKGGFWVPCNEANKDECAVNPAPHFGIHEKRYDVEGCCWWGRGVIQTTGVCNFGKLNYYLGKRAKDEGRPAVFGEVDFCKRPDKICSDPQYPDLKWFAGYFFHMAEVQAYNAGGWDYYTELKRFVQSGFSGGNIADTGFIHGVSGIVNRGCPTPPSCGTGELHGGGARAEHFAKVLKAFGLI
ncbi:MAG: uncharacterized protein KVP18_001793 [Porospora cf. gigantea A]|uniref:uncharacterized protein n=2 Tax=Porospora cf. gigantea A TaxID=2853593 RepID=UPI00355A219F|nr:MAG: hypothetical protein KVP18_001793 [Porospora cf. gigantea A]